MKVVILAGGFGTRLSEETVYLPKPMIEIGGMPILWHIMKGYAGYGYNDFIICAGYKQEYIKQWFADYYMNVSDVTFDYTNGHNDIHFHTTQIEPWKVTVVDTGLETMTGGRIKRVHPYIGDETFLMTYGDGVCDVNIDRLLAFHRSHGKIATLTSVVRGLSKGVLDISEIGAVRSFREKPMENSISINAGFMVLEPEIFSYLKDDTTVFEEVVLEHLAGEGQLMSYRHDGYWQCMDSLREKKMLEKIWETGRAPWKSWD